MAHTSTRDKLIDLAEQRIQTVGFNAFSFHDLAAEVGIKTASIHYHFPTKTDLAVAVLARYRHRINERLSTIADSKQTSPAKLEALFEVFAEPLQSGRAICLCGMLASDFETLPPDVQIQVRGFFADVEQWLIVQLQRGKAAGDINFKGEPASVAIGIIAALEGALLSARTFREPERYHSSIRWILQSLRA
jgi:TetR/AcrR family transcriptional regulator, transcriptional repressor for nem operon